MEIKGNSFVGDATKCFDGRLDKQENIRLAETYWENKHNDNNNPPICAVLVDGTITVIETIKEIKQQTEYYGVCTSIRAWYGDGREVEFGIVEPSKSHIKRNQDFSGTLIKLRRRDTIINNKNTIGQEYKNLILFLLISFFLPFVAIVLQGVVSNGFICFVLYGVQAAAPTISAITVFCLDKKAKIYFKQIFCKEHLTMAIILPLILASTTMILAKIIFCILFGRSFTFESVSITQFIIILWALWAEEIGWRGYLEPLLKELGVHRWLAPCMVGLVWCLWHYHFFLQNSMEVPILLFFISCIIESYIYSFLMNITSNNIVSAMIYHFSWNLWIHTAALNPDHNDGSIFPYIILVILETLVLLIFWSVRKEN